MCWPGYHYTAWRRGWRSSRNYSFLYSCRVSRSCRTYFVVTRSRHPLSMRFLPFLVSPVIAGTFPFARKLARIFSLESKGILSKFYLQFAIYSRALGQLPCKTKAVFKQVLGLCRGVRNHGLYCFVYSWVGLAEIRVSYTGWIRHVHGSTVVERLNSEHWIIIDYILKHYYTLRPEFTQQVQFNYLL